jgi:peroxiredoxin
MRWKRLVGLLALCGTLALAGAPLVSRGEKASADGGRKVADFTLTDPRDGKAVSLADFGAKKAVVVVFLGTECPISNAYLPRLAALSKEYAPRGVQFLAVNANSQDTPARVAAHARKHAVPFPVLKDDGCTLADLVAARRTPEAFVLDADRRVRYRGRIDDQYGLGTARSRPTRRDLALALDEVLAGKPVGTPAAPAPGCLIARPVAPKAGVPRDLRPGGVAPAPGPLPGVPPARPDRPHGAAQLRRRQQLVGHHPRGGGAGAHAAVAGRPRARAVL